MNLLILTIVRFFAYATHVETGEKDNVVKVIIPDSLFNDKDRDVLIRLEIDAKRKKAAIQETFLPSEPQYDSSNKSTCSSPPDLPPRNRRDDFAVYPNMNNNVEESIYDVPKTNRTSVSSNSTDNSKESSMGTLQRLKSKLKKKKPVEDDKADLPK